MRTGYIDLCMQSHCAGWAAEDDRPALLEVFVNGRKVDDIACDLERPDLAAHGFPSGAGFSYVFSAPLRLQDSVDVRFRDGPSLGNSPTSQHSTRLARLLEGISPGARGLELGPLDRPVLGKDEYDVRYVDHASRADLIQKYVQTGSAATVCPEKIQEVDFVWSDRLVRVTGTGFSYCVASHVIEHVADPVGWLIEIAEVLEPGGRVNLAVPEKTRTFDHRRTPSTAAAMLDAHVRRLRRPSFAQIFDHIATVSPIGGPEPDPVEAARQAHAVGMAVEASGQYVDVHCHVWTHESFAACWAVIDPLGLVPLRLATITPPMDAWNEFTVSFVRI